MSAYTFRSSRPDQWVSPRPTRDPARLSAIHGPLRPMQARLTFRIRSANPTCPASRRP
jgi:hypothetical protein